MGRENKQKAFGQGMPKKIQEESKVIATKSPSFCNEYWCDCMHAQFYRLIKLILVMLAKNIVVLESLLCMQSSKFYPILIAVRLVHIDVLPQPEIEGFSVRRGTIISDSKWNRIKK